MRPLRSIVPLIEDEYDEMRDKHPEMTAEKMEKWKRAQKQFWNNRKPEIPIKSKELKQS